MLPSFEVFGLEIPMFGVMMMIGMLAAFILLWRTHRYIRFSEDTLFSAALWAIICGLIGAKLLYWIVEIDQVIADPSYLLHTLREGFVFYGALIGGVLGVLIYSAKKKLPFFAFIDLFAPSLTLAQAFGRIGCFCAGCCYGCQTDGWCAVTFPAGSAAPAGIPLLPTQLMESAFLFLLTIVLVLMLKRSKVFGTVTGWYLVLYGVWRFIIEFFRSDDRGTVGALSTSQFIAIFLVAAGIVLLLLIAKRIVSRGTLPDSELQRADQEEADEDAAEQAGAENDADAEKAAEDGGAESTENEAGADADAESEISADTGAENDAGAEKAAEDAGAESETDANANAEVEGEAHAAAGAEGDCEAAESDQFDMNSGAPEEKKD